ncbi:MAG TPA: metalloregulator ArsR/SmtB family transcription factor [Vicinamibacterales bacterium]|jgi:ArsR family transcriptional regulator
MKSSAPAILDHLASLADTTRSRILLLLDRHELTVSELCGIMQLPQSTVSRHLKALSDSGWTAARAEGTSNLYTMTRPSTTRAGRPELVESRDELDSSARRLWLLVREQVGSSSSAVQDQRRLQAALVERRTKSQEFFSSSAGQWDRVRDELFGDRFHLAALAAFAHSDWTVGDLGCGTGQISAVLAPFVARIVAVDASAAMLQAAKKRLHGFDNVDLRRGELEALPVDAGRLDAATLMLVLHHVPEPERALAEVARVLKPGGRLILVDMLPHERENYRQQMGHVWLGFSDGQMRRMFDDAGFGEVRIVALPPDPRTKGPGLFVATATQRLQPGSREGTKKNQTTV